MSKAEYDELLASIGNCSSMEEVKIIKEGIEKRLFEARQKIGWAKTSFAKGEEVEPDWFGKLQSYKRGLGFLHQRALLKENEFNKAGKKQRQDTLDRTFVDTAREILPYEKFHEILQIAIQKSNQ
jgi:hypothetical protein